MLLGSAATMLSHWVFNLRPQLDPLGQVGTAIWKPSDQETHSGLVSLQLTRYPIPALINHPSVCVLTFFFFAFKILVLVSSVFLT